MLNCSIGLNNNYSICIPPEHPLSLYKKVNINYDQFLPKNLSFFKDIKSTESVSICIRQNRFSERKRDITPDDEKNSTIFTEDQIKYINKSIEIIKSKINNPKFFLWSNDFKNLDSFFPKNNFTFVSTNKSIMIFI